MATINLGRIKPIWQGAWDSGTSYIADDIVYYNNSAWIAQTANTNSAPSGVNANWELMVLGTDIPSQTGNTGKVLTTDGSSLSWGLGLPTQTSNSGKYLTTDGTNASWATITQNFVKATFLTDGTRRSIGSNAGDQTCLTFGNVVKARSDSYLYYHIIAQTYGGANDASYHKVYFGSDYFVPGQAYTRQLGAYAEAQPIIGRTTQLAAGTYAVQVNSSSDGQANNGGLVYNPNNSDDGRFPDTNYAGCIVYEIL